MEQPRPKKRRRRRKKETNDSAIGTFSISVDAARGDDEATTPGSFASVRSRAEALGGTYSATVHRHVHVLLASAGAVERKTQRVRKADRAAHEAEKNSWKARTEAEMDALDGKIRRLLRTRDAEIASLREALSAARGERDRAQGYLEELGNELPLAAAAGDCY